MKYRKESKKGQANRAAQLDIVQLVGHCLIGLDFVWVRVSGEGLKN
jgi:hypothetical protein